MAFANAQDLPTAAARRDLADSVPGPERAWAGVPGANSSLSTPALRETGTGRGAEFGEQHIVQRRAHPEPWSASTSADLFYTDNVALTSISRQDDWYLRYGATVGYTNRVRGPFFVDLSLQQYFFRYQKFDSLDFDLTRFEASMLMETPWQTDGFFFVRYRLERLNETGWGSALFTQHFAEVGLQKVWKIRRGQQLFAGLAADLALDTDPRAGARNEYSLSIGHSLRLTERISAGLSYRGSFYDYLHHGREDWNHILSAGLTYAFTDWLRLGLNYSLTKNYSNAAFADYYNSLPGIGAVLHLSF